MSDFWDAIPFDDMLFGKWSFFGGVRSRVGPLVRKLCAADRACGLVCCPLAETIGVLESPDSPLQVDVLFVCDAFILTSSFEWVADPN